MAGQSERQIVSPHPAAVIGHPDQRLAAIGIGNLDPPRPGIQRVFDQLLHGRGRTFDHLTRSDAVDGGLIQLPYDRPIRQDIGAFGVHPTRISRFRQIRPCPAKALRQFVV